jgi:hypothetical protein
MKIQFWILIAFNIAAMCVIVRATNFTLTVALVSILLLTNMLLGMALRRIPPHSKDSLDHYFVGLFHSASWSDYIPLLGGTICVLIGLLEFSWKPCVIGTAAIAIGVLRVWTKGRVKQALRDKR